MTTTPVRFYRLDYWDSDPASGEADGPMFSDYFDSMGQLAWAWVQAERTLNPPRPRDALVTHVQWVEGVALPDGDVQGLKVYTQRVRYVPWVEAAEAERERRYRLLCRDEAKYLYGRPW